MIKIFIQRQIQIVNSAKLLTKLKERGKTKNDGTRLDFKFNESVTCIKLISLCLSQGAFKTQSLPAEFQLNPWIQFSSPWYSHWKLLILTTLTRDIQSVSLLRMRQSVIICTMYPNTELWKLHLLFLGNRNSATPDTKNH